MQDIHFIKIFYPDDKTEEIIGIIENKNRLIRIIEIDSESITGFKEKGFINIDHIKKIEIISKAGCIGNSDEECK